MRRITNPKQLLPLCILVVSFGCSIGCRQTEVSMIQPATSPTANSSGSQGERKLETATFGGGCFWCVEAVFEVVKGVESVESGYAGGSVEDPTYVDVCTGQTGHAEVCQIKFDPAVVSYEKLLEIFWKTHDPTTLNRQGNDSGTQYRSVIYYHTEPQKAAAEELRKKLDESGAYSAPIVTEITAAPKYYAAEKYHQDYFAKNPTQGYCRAIISPKMDKFKKVFADQLKSKK